VRQFRAACGLRDGQSLLVTEFFLATQIIGSEEFIVADSLISQTLSQPYSRLLARLYFFALNLSMPGERIAEEHRNPAEMQNTLVREHLFVDGAFRAERFKKDEGIQPIVSTFGGFTSADALRKWVNNYSFLIDQCEFVRTPDGRLETFPDSWVPLALRLFFERYSIVYPAPDPNDLIFAAREHEIYKLFGVSKEWLEVRIAGAAEMFASDQTEFLVGFEESAIERQAAARGLEAPGPARDTERRETVIRQIKRRGENRKFLQDLYQGECQISGVKLVMPDGAFSVDCAHIRPLGRPHSGKDEVGNMLSLSPNMHRLFDRGCIRIDPESLEIRLLHRNTLTHLPKLRVRGGHVIQNGNLSYHLSNVLK
jgi:hypothetical protein